MAKLAQPPLQIELVGALGAALVLFGFYRTSIGRWSNKSLIYELDNLLGATLLGVYELRIGAYIPLVLNLTWAIVALRGITSIEERKIKLRRRK